MARPEESGQGGREHPRGRRWDQVAKMTRRELDWEEVTVAYEGKLSRDMNTGGGRLYEGC